MKDLDKYGSGGFASIQEGGINYRHVKIYFKSQRGGDIKFSVNVIANSTASTPHNQQQFNPNYAQPGYQQPVNQYQPANQYPPVQYPPAQYQPNIPQPPIGWIRY